ncbi:hypothetical protein QZH41_004324 [Actinostola sp. cb2023]|nr:hypothetical protein QZH41_004324 [Actinostola sp. cb2023]
MCMRTGDKAELIHDHILKLVPDCIVPSLPTTELHGCDTTSRPHGIGKVTVLKKYAALKNSTYIFMSPSSSKEAIEKAGEAPAGDIRVSNVTKPQLCAGEEVPGDGGDLCRDIQQRVSRKPRPRKPRPKTPDLENPDLENPDLENPDLENPDPYYNIKVYVERSEVNSRDFSKYHIY